MHPLITIATIGLTITRDGGWNAGPLPFDVGDFGCDGQDLKAIYQSVDSIADADRLTAISTFHASGVAE